MKNPFASLKKLKKKEVAIFAGILALLLIFFVIRKQNSPSSSPTVFTGEGDSNETRNQISDMKQQNDTAISNLRDEMASQKEEINAGMIGLKDGINDIISYNGTMQNQIPIIGNVLSQFDDKFNAVMDSNNSLKDMINESSKNVSPTPPPATKPSAPVSTNSIFRTGTYKNADSASKALEYMTSVGGKNASIVREADGTYRAVATYEDQAKSKRVGENLHTKGMLKTYYATGENGAPTVAVTKTWATKTKPVTKPVVAPKKK